MKKIYDKLTVLIIEDDLTAAKHLEEIFSLIFQKVWLKNDGCIALEFIENNKPDIIISDIKLPCMNGLEVIRQIKLHAYNPFIAITSAFSDKHFLFKAIDLHIDAYLLKPIDTNVLFEKIKEYFTKKDQEIRQVLSTREYEVFLELAKGLKPSQIAEIFSIRPKTVSTYRERIFEKMRFRSNTDLISYAIKHNFI